MIAEDLESGQLSSTNVTIELTDINDHPPVFVSSPFTATVLETAEENAKVVTIEVSIYTR